jgi:hypothetical protein
MNKKTLFLCLLSLSIIGSSACSKAAPVEFSSGQQPQSDSFCVVDSVKELRLVTSIPECAASDQSCKTKCDDGNGEYCLARAYTLQKESGSDEEIEELFRKACKSGMANGCTNHAAGIWGREHSEKEFLCVNNTFSRSCGAGEHFACGMAGRIMAESARNEQETKSAKDFLESKCTAVGGFSCRILAKHYEEGDFGPVRSGMVTNLLKKACDGGDPGGCGDPKTASETFK